MGQSSPEAIASMQMKISKLVQAEQQLIQDIKRDYVAIGQEWDDAQYRQLGNVVDEITRQLSANQAGLSQCNTNLGVLKSKLEDYLRMKI